MYTVHALLCLGINTEGEHPGTPNLKIAMIIFMVECDKTWSQKPPEALSEVVNFLGSMPPDPPPPMTSQNQILSSNKLW